MAIRSRDGFRQTGMLNGGTSMHRMHWKNQDERLRTTRNLLDEPFAKIPR